MSAVVLLLFLISGACGLIYQVAWSRLMTQIFGTSALAVGIVLAAFMAGLALGSFATGRLGPRLKLDPLIAYGVIEILIGAGTAILIPVVVFFSAKTGVSVDSRSFIPVALLFARYAPKGKVPKKVVKIRL